MPKDPFSSAAEKPREQSPAEAFVRGLAGDGNSFRPPFDLGNVLGPQWQLAPSLPARSLTLGLDDDDEPTLPEVMERLFGQPKGDEAVYDMQQEILRNEQPAILSVEAPHFMFGERSDFVRTLDANCKAHARVEEYNGTALSSASRVWSFMLAEYLNRQRMRSRFAATAAPRPQAGLLGFSGPQLIRALVRRTLQQPAPRQR